MAYDKKGVEQRAIRGNGLIPVINVEATCLAQGIHKAIIACHDYGCRVETPKQKPGMTLGYDADITVRITNPTSEPQIYTPAFFDTPIGTMQYILEVTHGIHNHWLKCPEHPEWWGYTYNGRLVDQMPFVFQRIKHDWETRGRITGRDYQATTWRAGEDIVLEQDDPPCLQSIQMRFLQNRKGEIVMNYLTHWRSRDEKKAWNQNNTGQVRQMQLLAKKVSSIIGEEVKLGAYIDHASSLHLYGLYFDRDNLEGQIKDMERKGWRKDSMTLSDYLGDEAELKRIIHAQSLAEQAGHGLNQPEGRLGELLGVNLNDIKYPAEWDTWPKAWDVEPDPSKLARVIPLAQ